MTDTICTEGGKVFLTNPLSFKPNRLALFKMLLRRKTRFIIPHTYKEEKFMPNTQLISRLDGYYGEYFIAPHPETGIKYLHISTITGKIIPFKETIYYGHSGGPYSHFFLEWTSHPSSTHEKTTRVFGRCDYDC